MTALCRDCDAIGDGGACAACGSRRLVAHPELGELALAHLDCDAFYASIEQRDDPALKGRPVIVGGGRRGVVLAASYEARRFGIHSAMPMFKALPACPSAIVVPPDMAKYRQAAAAVRTLMQAAAARVEPLSIDEAFLDLSDGEGCAAVRLSRLARAIEREVGITASIGLSWNKLLAKLASDLDKPRGFAVIGRAEATAVLAPLPVSVIWGVGPAFARRLGADGLATVGDLQRLDEAELVRRFGRAGARLARLAQGDDRRRVTPDRRTASISVETTFERDIAAFDALRGQLWRVAKRLAARLRASGLAGGTVVLKLKRSDFRVVTRSRRMAAPTQSPERIYAAVHPLLRASADGTRYRLIGVGVTGVTDAASADPPDLFAAAPPAALNR